MAASLLLQAVPFVHPAIAVGALASGLIPLIVHLVNRRRHRRVPWAAMSFLLAAKRRSSRRVRLEQWLLMLTRIAVIVLLGLAVARPFVPASSLLAVGSSRVHRILLIDNSLSMNAQDGDQGARLEQARRCAGQLLASFPETDAISVVTLAEPAQAVVAHAAYDRRIVRERVSAIPATQRRADPVGAMTRALEILRASEAPAGSRAVYVISDLPRWAWLGGLTGHGGADASGATPALTAARRLADALEDPKEDLNLIRVGGRRLENVAVTRLVAGPSLLAVGLPVRFVAEVVNFGSLSARDLALQIQRDGEIVRREPLPPLEPGGTIPVLVSTEFGSAGTHAVEARLLRAVGDALPEDDARYLSVEVRGTIPVLLVDGRPGATVLEGEAGYLATALAPRVAGGPGDRFESETAPWSRRSLIAPKIISEPELAGEALTTYDVVALCDVPQLSTPQWKHLEQYVQRGGGLLVFAGDLLSTDNYNRHGYAEGHGLLGATISRPIAPAETPDVQVGFELTDVTHSITHEFAGHPDSGLFLARVDRHLRSEVDPSRADVALRYTNGEPAMIVSRFGQGRVVLWTTTAGMGWNNLAAKGDFVSLSFNTVAFLSPRHGDHRNIMVGQTVAEPLTSAQSSLPLRVTTSEGKTVEGRIVPVEAALTVEYGPVEQAGGGTIAIGSEVRGFAANVDPREGNLTAVGREELTAALDRPVDFIDGVAGITDEPMAVRSNELASLALGAVVMLLLVETWLAMRFGSHGRGG